MSIKVFASGKEALEKIKKGIDLSVDLIRPTLGGKGKNVIIDEDYPRSKNDGFYILSTIEVEDELENVGCKMMKELSRKSNEEASDGTTSTAIIAQALINSGASKKQLEEDKEIIDKELANITTKLTKNEEIKSVAKIAGGNDEKIGNIISSIYKVVGNDAAVLVEKGGVEDMEVKIAKGIYFNEGYRKARAFINNFRKGVCEMTDVAVLCVDGPVNRFDEVGEFISKCFQDLQKQGKSGWDFKLLVVCKDFDLSGQTAQFFAENMVNATAGRMEQRGDQTLRHGFFVCVVEAPRSYGNQTDILEDIAIATGGKLVGEKPGTSIKNVKPEEVLGIADKVIVESNTTLISGGKGDDKILNNHIQTLLGEVKDEKNTKRKESLENRAKILSSGVGIIKVGGITEFEAGERMVRVEDAVGSAKSAIKHGICEGGGMTYWRLAQKVKYTKKSLKSVVKQLLENSDEDESLLSQIETTGNGYNVITGQLGNMNELGIIDSAKTIKTVLDNSYSFAQIFNLTSGVIAPKRKKDEK